MHQPGKHRIAVVSTNSRRCRRIAAAASIFYDIVVLGDPIRAPAVLAAQPPDVLLVDAQLPIRGGGIDFLLAVRRSPALAELPAILITGPEGGGRTAAALG
ncbi:MAG: hypothetical protein F8N37_25635, partial [Telmatospirillum sp.]|nr:hypothetical protein [Telmatospirillum sp.]